MSDSQNSSVFQESTLKSILEKQIRARKEKNKRRNKYLKYIATPLLHVMLSDSKNKKKHFLKKKRLTSVEASSQKQKSSSQKDENQLLNQLDNFLKKNNMEKLRQTIGSLEKDIEHGNKDQTNKKKIQQQLRRKKIELDILENPPLQYKIPDLGNDLQIKNVEKEIQQLERKIEQVDKDIKKNIRSKKIY